MSRYVSYRDFDWVLLGFVLIICGLGVMEIHSATVHTKFAGAHIRQIYWVMAGVGAMFLISLVNYQALLDQIHWFYIAAVGALMAVLVFGQKYLGSAALDQDAGRQPLPAVRMGQADPDSRRRQVFCRHAAAGTFLVRFHEGRGDRRHSHADGSGAAGSGYRPHLCPDRRDGCLPGRFAVEARDGRGPAGGRRGRGCILHSPGARTQVVSEAAFDQLSSIPNWIRRARGTKLSNPRLRWVPEGLWGGKGSQTHGAFLPVPQTDFIFAAFSEEHGFVGALGVLLLYFIVLMRLTQNAQTAPDRAGTFVVMGVVAVLSFHILVNVGMVVGFMPVTGIPLPLMSYGGSSVLFMFLALGMVMNVRMRRFVN